MMIGIGMPRSHRKIGRTVVTPAAGWRINRERTAGFLGGEARRRGCPGRPSGRLFAPESPEGRPTMRSLTLGAALLLASAGAASPCWQGDRDCADAMSLGRETHHHLMLPDAPDEQQQKYDSGRQDFGRAHANAQAAAEHEAWEKKQHPDRPPPWAIKVQEPAKAVADRADPDETPAAKTAKS